MNLIINGAYKCPRCGSQRWKVESIAGVYSVYCVAEYKRNLYCCWHLDDSKVDVLIKKINCSKGDKINEH